MRRMDWPLPILIVNEQESRRAPGKGLCCDPVGERGMLRGVNACSLQDAGFGEIFLTRLEIIRSDLETVEDAPCCAGGEFFGNQAVDDQRNAGADGLA